MLTLYDRNSEDCLCTAGMELAAIPWGPIPSPENLLWGSWYRGAVLRQVRGKIRRHLCMSSRSSILKCNPWKPIYLLGNCRWKCGIDNAVVTNADWKLTVPMENGKVKVSKNPSLFFYHHPEEKTSSPVTRNIPSPGQLYLFRTHNALPNL